MRLVPLLSVLALFVSFQFANEALADALVVTKAASASTIAEIFVEKSGVRLQLEIGEADQQGIRKLLKADPNGSDEIDHNQIVGFFRDHFRVKADGGNALAGELIRSSSGRRLDRDEITGEPLAKQPADGEQVIRVEILFPLDSLPNRLSFSPPVQQATGYAAASIGFITFHEGLPVNDFRYLGTEVTLDLDWEDPWYSRFRHRNLRRQFDAPLSVYLYVEPYEVRKEIVLRPRDLQRWLDLDIDGKRTITVEQQKEIKERIATFLADKSVVEVDGKEIQGSLDRINFIHRSLRTSGIIEPPVDLDANSATLGIIFVHPIDQLPQQVKMKWDLFSSRLCEIPAVASDEAGGLPSSLTPEFPILEWKNYLKNPTIPQMLTVASPPEKPRWSIPVVTVVSAVLFLLLLSYLLMQRTKRAAWSPVAVAGSVFLVLIGILAWPYARVSVANPWKTVPQLTESESVTILSSLLHNIYRSFDKHNQSLVYDQLEQSIAGDLLADVYLETRRSMELKNQGGLRISVKEVVVQETQQENDDPESPQIRCRWRVSGSIGHWGHIHRRENEHVARITLADVGGHWKVTAMELLDEQAFDQSRSDAAESAKGNGLGGKGGA